MRCVEEEDVLAWERDETLIWVEAAGDGGGDGSLHLENQTRTSTLEKMVQRRRRQWDLEQ